MGDALSWADVAWVDPAVPGWLRLLATAGPHGPGWLFDGMPHGLISDARISADAVAAVPFLLALAAGAPANRADVLGLVAMIIDPRFETPGLSGRARDAVTARVAEVFALLSDPDPAVRTRAYLVLSRCGGELRPRVLWRRWEAEAEPLARVALLLALGARDPAAAREHLRAAAVGECHRARLAALLALHRAGLGLPARAASCLVEAVESGAGLAELGIEDAAQEVIAGTPDEGFALAFLAGILRPDSPACHTGVSALRARCRASRRAPERCVPLLRPLLMSASQPAREAAMQAAHACGRAAAQVADLLAATVERPPEMTGSVRVGAEQRAVATLQRLNDPRWIGPMTRLWAAGFDLDARGGPGYVPAGPGYVDALAREVCAAAGRGDARVVERLAGAAARLGSAALPPPDPPELRERLVAPLRAALPVAPRPVRRALLALGAAGTADLRALVESGDDVEAAAALFTATGEAGPLAGALIRRMACRTGPDLAGCLHAALPAGPYLGEAVPALRLLLGTAPPEVEVAAAHLLYRAGEARYAPAAVRAGLAGRPVAAWYAAWLARDLRDPALEPLLRGCLATVACVPAAEALIALGFPRSELTGPLLRWLSGSDDHGEIVRVCRDVLDASALPRVRELAERDPRSIDTGEVSSVIWRDEVHRDALRAGAAAARTA